MVVCGAHPASRAQKSATASGSAGNGGMPRPVHQIEALSVGSMEELGGRRAAGSGVGAYGFRLLAQRRRGVAFRDQHGVVHSSPAAVPAHPLRCRRPESGVLF